MPPHPSGRSLRERRPPVAAGTEVERGEAPRAPPLPRGEGKSLSVEIRNAACLATPLGQSARRGGAQGEVRRIRNAALRAENGRIVFVGAETDYAREYAGRPADLALDATGKTLLPGLVDAHTHPVWAGDRAEEIGRRLSGESYAKIAAEGGGILATVRATRAADDVTLREATSRRLSRMLAHGTTTAEAKSGYGLTVEEEIRSLRLLASLSEEGADPSPLTPTPAFADSSSEALAKEEATAGGLSRREREEIPRLVPTLLAAHDVPPEFRQDRAEWVRIVAEEIVPRAAREKLARFCDVFCDEGAFTVEESRGILEAARREGLLLRLHADELARSGGTLLAAELNASSADHLLRIGEQEIAALARGNTVAVLLPGTAWWMGAPPAPARALIEAGVPVAVASDANPGTCHTESLAAVAAHACLDSRLTVEEVLTAMTLNAAASLGLASEIGSLETGKSADVVLLDAPDDRHLIYHWGVNLVSAVLLRGRVVGSAPK